MMRRLTTCVAVSLLLAGCSDWLGEPEEPPLPGERIPILSLERGVRADPQIADLDVRLPPPWENKEWPQSGGWPSHAMHHLAAGGALDTLWETDIGQGSDSEQRLLAQPVVADGIVYSMDAGATVRAFEIATGDQVWSRDLEPDDDDEGILGGGLAFSDGRLFVTTGFAHVLALNAKSGETVWRKSVAGPMRAAPTIYAGRVYVVTIANELFALAADDGRSLWNHVGIVEAAGLLGGAAPAADDGIVIVPYSSGEIVALRAENGRVVWSDSLTALRRTDPISSLAHIRGMPVIDRGRVFVVSHSGRMAAIDLRTGNRIWERNIGGTNAPWVAGNFIYVVTRDSELVCLSWRDGRVRWVQPLQRFEDEEDQTDPILWAGPVLAGDRLIVASSHEEVWSLSPYSGKLLGRIELSSPVLMAPAIANETLFLLTDDADLIALK